MSESWRRTCDGSALALSVHPIPDPRTQFAAQELSHAAHALRGKALRSMPHAADRQFESCQVLFERSAKAYEELAGKFTRIAESMTP
jgi:hypothetical protein